MLLNGSVLNSTPYPKPVYYSLGDLLIW